MNTVAAAQPLVLVVEDEWMVASTLELLLTSSGYRVLGPAPTVIEAMDLLERERPDLALLDYRLATTTTEPLLEPLEARHIPVCVLTGAGAGGLPKRYSGCVVLEKPYSVHMLITALEGLIRQA